MAVNGSARARPRFIIIKSSDNRNKKTSNNNNNNNNRISNSNSNSNNQLVVVINNNITTGVFNKTCAVLVLFVLLIYCSCGVQVTHGLNINNSTSNNHHLRESRKLFGGYRITPRFCHPTRTAPTGVKGGPSICMFNHECAQRNGHVVGACMDGFLFGACCQLPGAAAVASPDPSTAITIKDELDETVVQPQENTLVDEKGAMASPTVLEITPDNAVVQIPTDEHVSFQPYVTNSYPNSAETVLIHTNGSEISNHISGEDFATSKLSTSRVESSTKPFYYHSSINYLTARPIQLSDSDKYVLVPTITKPAPSAQSSTKPSSPEIESIANIIQMLDDSAPNRIMTSETKAPTSTVPISSSTLVYSNTPIFSSTQKAPSTSYVFSTTIPPRPGHTKNPLASSTAYKPTTSYLFSPTKRPVTTTKKTSTSKRPTTTTSKIPPYSQTTEHYSTNAQAYSPSPSPPPTVIVLGPIADSSTASYSAVSSTPRPKPVSQVTINNMIQSSNTVHIGGNRPGASSTERPPPTVLITPKPSGGGASTASYWTTTQQRPLTTIIVKKPNEEAVEYLTTSGIVMGPSSSSSTSDDLINFPPVRNPNLNMSVSTTGEYEGADGNFEITTPTFMEDDELNEKVETFVNKIIQSLQGPFEDLRTVVYKNKTSNQVTSNTTKKPTKKPVKTQTTAQTTRKPTVVTTKKPIKKPTTKKPTTQKLTTRRPTATTLSVTTKRTKPPPRRTTTTTSTTATPAPSSSSSEETYEESDEYYEDTQSPAQTPDYKRLCGVRPLMRSGRIVGGKGATFGEWPWQVLVKESTWLGLFTKNKCGGVLISSKYVITAAHCQPGFLASLVAVFGEFDISGELESKRSVSRPVKRVIVHRQYNAATFENDLALLELDTPITFDTHIVPICLPPDEEDFTGRMATVTGWGRLKYGGGVPSVLQEVQVPIMENSVCQEMFRTAGHSKVIIESFLCAGYANGQKDSCEGDSGGPLTLQRADGRWELAGTVSHGIKCAAPYLPGVYMRTTYFKPWLTSITGLH